MFTTFGEWKDEYHNHLLNMYDVYVKYKRENMIDFDEFCIIVFKSDFNIS